MEEAQARKSTRDLIISLWNSLERPGKEAVVSFLEKSDFFDAPSSTQYHLAVLGGLAEHSMNVYQLLKNMNDRYGSKYSKETIVICGLGHDLCKVGFYAMGERNVKDASTNWQWMKKEVWKVEDQFPYGHGEKSVTLLQDMIFLQPEEKLAIRWHMGFSDPGTAFSYPSGYPFNSAMKVPLVAMLHMADMEAALMLEREEKK